MIIQQRIDPEQSRKVEIQDSKIKRIPSNRNKSSVHSDAHSAHTNDEKKFDSNISKFPNIKKEKCSLIDKVLEFIQSDDALLIFLLVILLQDGVDDWILFLLIGYLLISDKVVLKLD